ncbi:protein PHOX1-like [Salvia hispanica]|uniref:protein PHOX1-like n=1 Tax=Salvia hispanica TaxID=49212 RepID=UPI0020096FCD|nr:protein PHOX1-like [Salvia hispanica]
MGKHGGKKKKSNGHKSGESNIRQSEGNERAYDKDTKIFVLMSQELKEDGNRLFQKRDYEGAMLSYEKGIELLPRNHVDVAYLRSNMAACYMQLGISEYPRAIRECNLALEVSPLYSKALLKRARCYEALNKLDLARRDVGTVLKMEPNNLMAIEISERVEMRIERQGSRENEIRVNLVVPLPEYLEPPPLAQAKASKEKAGEKKSGNVKVEKGNDNVEENVMEKRVNGKVNNIFSGDIDNSAEKKKIDCNVKENAKEEKVNGVGGGSKDDQTRHEKKTKRKVRERKVDVDVVLRKVDDQIEERKTEDKLVVEEERFTNGAEEEPTRMVKLVFGEDIRWAQIPLNCDILKLREIIVDRFPSSKAVLVKYRDQEGDMVTITSTEELRLAEASTEHGSVKLYIVEVNPDQDPLFERIRKDESIDILDMKNVTEIRTESACISDWIIQFAQLFKNHVGFDFDAYLDLHEVGMKLYSDAMEETVTCAEAQDLFSSAAEKFQEMAALALFNWGNVHMSRARKRVYLTENASKEPVLTRVKSAYEWARAEYVNAGKRYEEALKIKPNFYEAILALGQQEFEQAKLSWYYAIGTNADLESWPSLEVLKLYNRAEENMEKGMQMWEEEQQVNEPSWPNKIEIQLQNMKLNSVFKNMSADEAAEQASKTRAQIHILWGTMLYERSMMEFKLGLPVWNECLEVAVEKFELAGAAQTDIAVMIKNHCSNGTASEGGFNIDEIVQAWNEMYEAKKWPSIIPSFRLEPLLRRRVSKIYYAFENA